MYLYNVTYIIETQTAQEWLAYFTETHVAKIMACNKFVSNRFLKVIDSPNEGVTYCAQYIAETAEALNDFRTQLEPALQEELFAKFENKFVSFSTVMKFVD